jgi:hypothetical protein
MHSKTTFSLYSLQHKTTVILIKQFPVLHTHFSITQPMIDQLNEIMVDVARPYKKDKHFVLWDSYMNLAYRCVFVCMLNALAM